MTQHPNPADLRPEQIAEVERLFAEFPNPLIRKAVDDARRNVGMEEKPGD